MTHHAAFAPSLGAHAALPGVPSGGLCARRAGGFGIAAAPPAPRAAPGIVMKKNRFHAPLRPKRPEEVKVPEDGTPVFAIFVRTNRARIWYPLGSVQGDAKSKQLVGALKNSFGRALYANALDKGIAQTVYGKDTQRFITSALRMYPQLKRYQRELEFGYKVTAAGLDPQPTKAVTREMSLSFGDWAKQQWSKTFNK